MLHKEVISLKAFYSVCFEAPTSQKQKYVDFGK